MTNNDQESQKSEVTFELVWNSDVIEELPVEYTNQVIISHTDEQFFIIFGQAIPPATLDMNSFALEHEHKLDVKPIVRLAVPAKVMKRFIDVFNKNWGRYQTETEASDDGMDSTAN